MGQFVAMCGSLGEGVTVFGPYVNKLSAELDTEEMIRGGWCDASVIDFLPLVKDVATTRKDYILVLGDLEEGFTVYGTYASSTLAANASSPFRPNPINPNAPDGPRLAVVLRMLPPLTI